MEKKPSSTKGKGVGHREPTMISLRESDGWTAEPETVKRVQEISEKICKGESRGTIQAYIKEAYSVGDRQARAYYSAAMKYLMPDDEEEYRKGLIQANLDRLEQIVQETMKEGSNPKSYQVAVQAIKAINDIINPKQNSVTVAKDNNGNEAIVISFD